MGRREPGKPGRPSPEELDQYGKGERGPTGVWEWYELPEDVEERLNRDPYAPTAEKVWAHADLIAADLLSEYGVDVDSLVMDERSGPWLRRLVDGLFSIDCRLTRILRAEREKAEKKDKAERV